jgi:hypothetical protein
MLAGGLLTDGPARVAVLGAGHSFAYLLGCLLLVRGLGRRAGGSVLPKRLGTMVLVSAAVGLVVWLASRVALEGSGGRLRDLVVLAVAGVVGGALVYGGYRVAGLPAALTQRTPVSGTP